MVGWNHSVVLYCFRKIVSELVVGSNEQLSLSALYTKEMASGSIDWRDTWVCKSIELTGLDHYLSATVVTPVAPAVKSLGWVRIEPDVIRQFAPCTLIISSSFVMAHELDVPIYFGIMCIILCRFWFQVPVSNPQVSVLKLNCIWFC